MARKLSRRPLKRIVLLSGGHDADGQAKAALHAAQCRMYWLLEKRLQQLSMMKMKTAMVLAAVSVLVSGCAETKSQAEIQGIQGVSAQDPFYLIHGWHYEQDGIGWFTDTVGKGRRN
jgi:hypothetical protein